MKLIAKIVIVIVVFLAGIYVGGQQVLSPTINWPLLDQSKTTTTTPNLAEEISVSLMLDFGNGQVRTYNDVKLPLNASAFDLLKKVTTENNFALKVKDYGEMGAFVEGVGDIENDKKGDRYWQLWVNNQYAEVGASNYQLKVGDIVEWKFIRGQIN